MGNGWSKYTTEDKTALTSTFNMFHCLELAINERAEFIGNSPLNITNRLDNKPLAFCQFFESVLDTIIPKFGRIIDGAYIAYTKTSIYEELEETRLDSRLPAYKLNPLYCHLWFEQIIRVINKLNLFGIGTYQQGAYYGDEYAGSGSGTTLNSAVDSAISNSINTGGWIDGASGNLRHLTYPIGSGSSWSATVLSTVFTACRWKYVPLHMKDLTLNVDVLVRIEKFSNGEFNAGNSGFIEGNQVLFENISVNTYLSEYGYVYFDVSDIPGENISNYPKYSSESGKICGYIDNGLFVIYRGNFKFIAGS